MKIAVTSDWQWDSYNNISTALPDGTTSRLADLVACWDWMLDKAVEKGVTHLFVLGDIYDSRTTIELPVLDRVCRSFARAKKKGLATFALVGNHDACLRTPAINSLQTLSGSAVVVDAPYVLKFDEDIACAFLPWIEDEDALVEAVYDLYKQSRHATRKYLFAHVTVAGLFPGTGVAPDSLLLSKWDQVLLGDVHDPLEVSDNARYVGSPLQLQYGDAGKARGFVILDTDKDKIEYIENDISPRFHTLRTKKLKKGEITAGDFVRVQDLASDDAAEMVAAAKAAGAKFVRNDVPTVDISELPRVACSASDDIAVLLQKYMDYLGVDAKEQSARIKQGVALFKEGITQ